MNEMNAVRELLSESAPPSMEVVAAAELRLSAELTGRSPRHRPVRRRMIFGSGLVAAGAAVVLAVNAIGTGPATSPGVRAEPTELNPRSIILAAAEKAEMQPTGRYWFSDQITGQSYIVKARTGSYTIVGAHGEYFQWAGAKKGDGQAFYGRDLPARLPTAQDRAALRKAGSPTSFPVVSNGDPHTYNTELTRWRVDHPDPKGGGSFFIMGTGLTLTLAQVQNLPSDPGKLADVFFGSKSMSRYESKLTMMGMRDPAGWARMNIASDIFESAPLPPKVRAGLMRALVAQPGVRTIDAVTDPLGRKGVALAAAVSSQATGREKPRGYDDERQLIFDRDTGALLGQQDVLTKPGGMYRDQKPGFIISYWLIRDSGFVNSKPTPPAKPPF
jgi:hypothetical protein